MSPRYIPKRVHYNETLKPLADFLLSQPLPPKNDDLYSLVKAAKQIIDQIYEKMTEVKENE